MSKIYSIGGDFGLTVALHPRGMPEILAFGVGGGLTSAASTMRAPRTNGLDVAVPSAVLLPTGGMGFFGWPAIQGHRDGGDFVAEFIGWQAAEGTRELVLTARDETARLAVRIELKAPGTGVLSMRSAVANQGYRPYVLDRCMAGAFLAEAGSAEITSFAGMWAREFQARTEPLGRGLWLQESWRAPPVSAFRSMSDDQSALLAGTRPLSLHTLRTIGLAFPALQPETGVILELKRADGVRNRS